MDLISGLKQMDGLLSRGTSSSARMACRANATRYKKDPLGTAQRRGGHEEKRSNGRFKEAPEIGNCVALSLDLGGLPFGSSFCIQPLKMQRSGESGGK